MGIALALFVLTLFLLFWLLSPDNAEGKKKRALTPEENLPHINQENTAKRKDEIESLSQKLSNIKTEYKKLEEDLAVEKEARLKLNDEAERLKASLERDAGLEEKMRAENKELKEKLVAKGQEFEKEFGLNINLTRELEEYKQKASVLEKERRQDEERLNILEAQNKAYKEEVKRLNHEIMDLNKKSQESQWVSRREYEDLQAKLKEKENA